MEAATGQLLRTSWLSSGVRDVYSDFNAVTLQITTEALFGNNLSAEEGARVTGIPPASFALTSESGLPSSALLACD
jgi:hypothetical protein